jgi:hypothetical protein
MCWHCVPCILPLHLFTGEAHYKVPKWAILFRTGFKTCSVEQLFHIYFVWLSSSMFMPGIYSCTFLCFLNLSSFSMYIKALAMMIDTINDMFVNGWPISNQMAVVWIICPHTYVKHVQQNIYTHVMRLQSMFIYRFLFQIVRLQLKSTICHDWSSPNKHLQYICSKGILWGKLISLFAWVVF